MDIIQETKRLYKKYGQSKSMKIEEEPCFFLQRNFKGEQDMLIIFKTLPCQNHCKFCNLSEKRWHSNISVVEQFYYVVNKLKHSLSVLDRVTLSNNGSILDSKAVPLADLVLIIQALTQIKNVSTIVLETDIRFVNEDLLNYLQRVAGDVKLNILIGFETLDDKIRNDTLGKHKKLVEYERCLDTIANCNCDFTSHILYKPSQFMTDEEAYTEAKQSALYLINECNIRNINLTLRINPMFAATGTAWSEVAKKNSTYMPPKISDVYSLALELERYIPTYIGLSTEDKEEKWGSYRVRSDFNRDLLLKMIHFNSKKWYIYEFCN